MKLLVDQLNDVDIVRLPARLTMADAPGARKAIRQLVDAGRKHIVLDLARVTFVDSSGLSVLVSAREATRAAEGDGEDPADVTMHESDDENDEVGAAPSGATVPYLPDDANEETVQGKTYFVYAGTYYRPFASDGDTIYMVVEDPRQA